MQYHNNTYQTVCLLSIEYQSNYYIFSTVTDTISKSLKRIRIWAKYTNAYSTSGFAD